MDDKCVEAVEGEMTAAGQDAPRPVFLVPALDGPEQRQQVLSKVQEFIVAGVLNTFTLCLFLTLFTVH